MANRGRPRAPFPRQTGIFIRFSSTEVGAVEQALAREHPVVSRRPSLSAWLRDLAVAHASEVLQVEVTRSGLRHAEGGAPNWKRWKLSRAVKRAAVRRRTQRR
jgi:hypothetical protein